MMNSWNIYKNKLMIIWVFCLMDNRYVCKIPARLEKLTNDSIEYTMPFDNFKGMGYNITFIDWNWNV
jgi:hypothetical protein